MSDSEEEEEVVGFTPEALAMVQGVETLPDSTPVVAEHAAGFAAALLATVQGLENLPDSQPLTPEQPLGFVGAKSTVGSLPEAAGAAEHTDSSVGNTREGAGRTTAAGGEAVAAATHEVEHTSTGAALVALVGASATEPSLVGHAPCGDCANHFPPTSGKVASGDGRFYCFACWDSLSADVSEPAFIEMDPGTAVTCGDCSGIFAAGQGGFDEGAFFCNSCWEAFEAGEGPQQQTPGDGFDSDFGDSDFITDSGGSDWEGIEGFESPEPAATPRNDLVATSEGGGQVGSPFGMGLEALEKMDTEYNTEHSRDLAFANTLTVECEAAEVEAQRLQLEGALRVHGKNDLSALELLPTDPADQRTGGSIALREKKTERKEEKRRLRKRDPTRPERGGAKGSDAEGRGRRAKLGGRGGRGKKQLARAPISQATLAMESHTEAAQKRLAERKKLRATMAKSVKFDAPAKQKAPKKPVPKWGTDDVAAWLRTVVELASVGQWMLVVRKESIDGPKLLGLDVTHLSKYTSGFLTIAAEVDIVAEGIRRLNIEGAKAGRKTLRRAIGKRLGIL